jgi:DNA polymerase/3'-5' exonuclease PolX
MAEILNVDIARRLEDVVRLLKEQGANPYRVRAYHRAATTRRWLGRPVTEMLQQEGVEGLRKLPGLGESLTRTIHDLVVTGRLPRSTGCGARWTLSRCSRQSPGSAPCWRSTCTAISG